ncbi:cation channel family protein (macronuclear) [Tetrahymena thermophila SB210]|uniref:Cation channel family protein n=1 Tax=Tetrahymena thermophila (strain SB210) TaxID=312017 RepID=Q23AQ7_TETTS|nr:cation channel family protein [Tetrahymena thermophila SB210]EAR93635.2 cation channel family protein [Tetrahymena thermophila SB210]|eukprot:XP_001013880.2 cation channel family protein [Tetrahymena thermophila SB210]
MNESTMINDDTQINTHMNSIQFNEQDHFDLKILNQKQAETIKELTDEGINTEDIIQIQRKTINNNVHSVLYQQQVQNSNQQGEYDDKQFEQQKSTSEKKKQEQLTKQQVDIMTEKKKNITQESSISKIKVSVFSKDSFPLNQKESTPKTCSQIVQRKGFIRNQNPIKLIKSINLLVNVKSFYRLLTKNTRILGKLTRDQHYLINDISSVFQKNKQSKIFKLFLIFPKIKKTLLQMNNCISNMIACIPMFQPYNLSKFLWDILQAILILSVVFVILILDMLFTFNTGVVEKGNVIFDRKKAAKIYLKKNFIMDLLALLPLFMFYLDIKLEGLYSLVIYFQILMKLFVLSDTFNRLTYYLSYQKNMKNIVDLVKLVFIIACVCHIFCLFWHGLAIYEINQGSNTTWLQYRGIQDADVFTRYVQSFYYLAVTMITVGYGDITPQTTYEILFTTITMFVTGFFYAFSLNRIGSIIENIELKDKSYKENMQIIHRLMREENVQQTLRVQISNYLLYLYKESNEIGKQQEIEITNKLSKQLKYDLTQDIQGKYLKDIEFIDKLETKSKIVEIMEECLFSPGEYIFRQGDMDDCSLYYIVKGSVIITYDYQFRDQTESLIINQLKKSQYFGDMQFIQGNARILTAQASDFCRTYKIPREQFFKCIKESDQDFENFQMLKEAYIFKDNQKLFNMKCYTCNKSDHISIKCPKTHLTLSKQTLIQKENKSIPHLQREFKSRKQIKFNSIFSNFDIINGVYLFIEKDENLLDLQILEEEMHLSQDEAYLEQQLLELEKIDQNELFTKEIKHFEITNQTISEAEQEEDSTDEISPRYINDTLFSSNKQRNNTNQSSSDQNQTYEVELYQDNNSLAERSYSNKDKILSQSLKNKQVKSIEQIQSSTNNSFLDQLTQQDNQYDQRYQNIEKNSNISLSSQKNQYKQYQNSTTSEDDLIESQENIQSQIQNSQLNNDNIIQNQQKKKLDISSEKNNKKCFSDRKNNLVYQENSFEKSEELLNIEQFKQVASFVIKNQPTLKNEKIKMFQKKKSQSLTDLCEQIKSEQQNSNQIKSQFNIKTKNQIQQNKLNQLNLQIIRSQSCRETSRSYTDIEQQIKGNKKYLCQTADYRKKNTQQIKVTNTISSNNQIYEDCQQKSNSSIQNGSYSKQNMNYNSQTSLKSLTNNEIVQKREQSSKSLQQNQQELIRQQSKKIAQLRQFKLQRKQSLILSPSILQYQLNQNQNTSTNPINNQFNQNNQSHNYQYQENNQNSHKNLQSINQKLNSNQINNHQNQILLSQISFQLKNSPLIQYRHKHIHAKNMLTQRSQETQKRRNSNCSLFELQENSLRQLDAHKKRPSISSEVNLKESIKKQQQHQQGSKLDIISQIQNNSYLQNNLSLLQNQLIQQNILSQEDNIQKLAVDSSYLMLQIFDKPNIFKHYYPNYNINIVIQNLKQSDRKINKTQSLRKQVSRNIASNKRALKQVNQIKLTKANTQGSNKIKNLDINLNQN